MTPPAADPSRSEIEVLTVGETMAALRARNPLKLGGSLDVSIAGAESNVAIGLARLGHRSAWAGRVGDDSFGHLVLRTLRAEGVDITGARMDDGAPTGLIVFEPSVAGLNRVHYRRAGSAGSRLEPADVDGPLARAPRVVHLTGITPALSAGAAECVAETARRARQNGITVTFDVNYRSRLWDTAAARAALAPLCRHADILIASPDELALVAPSGRSLEAQVEAVLHEGPERVVVKDGVRGAWSHGGGQTLHSPARKVTAVDTVGAGDAFTAGYLSALLDGATESGRLHRGATVAAFAVSGHGDWESLPTRDELPLLDLEEGATVR